MQVCVEGQTDSDDPEAKAIIAASEEIPMHELPELPARGWAYWTEPLMGIAVVGFFCLLLCSIVYAVTQHGTNDTELARSIMRYLITLEAVIAGLCVLYLLNFQNAGEIRRSRETCYPIPDEVTERLKEGCSLEGLHNISRVRGDPAKGTYCVRCLVWRPTKQQKPHHCNTCQRCVVEFDHHCGVFGRCIVDGNMTCFTTLITMLCVGIGTTMVAVVVSSAAEG